MLSIKSMTTNVKKWDARVIKALQAKKKRLKKVNKSITVQRIKSTWPP